MTRIIERLAKQVEGRRSGRRPRARLHVMVNDLLAWALQVDAYLHSLVPLDDKTPVPKDLEDILIEGQNLKERAKAWLGDERF